MRVDLAVPMKCDNPEEQSKHPEDLDGRHTQIAQLPN